jgi:hypothetical protein
MILAHQLNNYVYAGVRPACGSQLPLPHYSTHNGKRALLPLPPGEGWGGGAQIKLWLNYLLCRLFIVAGGSPAASHFFCLAKKSDQKKATQDPPPLRGSLRCSNDQAAAELALRAQTVLADSPWSFSATRWRMMGGKNGFSGIQHSVSFILKIGAV